MGCRSESIDRRVKKISCAWKAMHECATIQELDDGRLVVTPVTIK